MFHFNEENALTSSTVKSTVDLGSCLRLRKLIVPSFRPSTVYTDKNKFGLSAVVFFKCEIIQLFSAMLSVVRVVHKLAFRLVTNESPSHAMIETHPFDRNDIFPLIVVASVKGL